SALVNPRKPRECCLCEKWRGLAGFWSYCREAWGRALCKTSNDNEYRLQCRIRITSLHIFFAALLLFTLLLVITRDQSVIALNREYFPGRAHGGFSSFRTMTTRLWRRLGLRPRFFVTDAKALGKVCGG
ncbi:hypothetical protein K3Z99_33410, partial [Pseudomonas aeruginosa]|nr:hypothetical protein [Pseudomonas aeruginosa]